MREKILLIDDSVDIHRLLKAHLGSRFKILSAFDGESGVVLAVKKKPDLVLLDVEMPRTHGYDVCRQLKVARETRSIPIMFLTAARTTSERITGWDAGASDYITKPFEPVELQQRISAVLRRQRALNDLVSNTGIDELTGLFDRRYFEAQLESGFALALCRGKPLACILIDIDHMHSVNGAFGRYIGDQMLAVVSQNLLHVTRRKDVLCRYAGDKFALLVVDAIAPALNTYADHLLTGVRKAMVYDSNRVIQVKASIGVAISTMTNGVSLIPLAEEALCRAKQSGDTFCFGRDSSLKRTAA